MSLLAGPLLAVIHLLLGPFRPAIIHACMRSLIPATIQTLLIIHACMHAFNLSLVGLQSSVCSVKHARDSVQCVSQLRALPNHQSLHSFVFISYSCFGVHTHSLSALLAMIFKIVWHLQMSACRNACCVVAFHKQPAAAWYSALASEFNRCKLAVLRLHPRLMTLASAAPG